VAALKYSDEAAAALKYSDEAAAVLKNSDEAAGALGKATTGADAIPASSVDNIAPTTGAGKPKVDADGLGAAGKNADEAIESSTKSLDDPNKTLSRDPVDVVTGAMVYKAVDFEFPGPIPLVWGRSWYSDSSLTGHLGYGTRSGFEMGIEEFDDKRVGVYLSDGRMVVFPRLFLGDEHYDEKETLILRREIGNYSLFDPKNRYTYLFYPSENGYMRYKLKSISNAQEHSIAFEYCENGFLSKVIDSTGRELTITTNSSGLITQAALGGHVLVRYRYNRDRDLTEVIDSAGQSAYIKYQNHLIVQKIDRNGNSFYWKYDGSETGARVIETWGDGDVLRGTITYHDDSYRNVVTDSLGNPTVYYYDDRKLCVRVVNPDGSEIRRKYNDKYELISETDEEGRKTAYTFGLWSKLTEVKRHDGSKHSFVYDEKGRLISATNPEGASRNWAYNNDDTLRAVIDESGAETVYDYYENKLVKSVTNAKGGSIWLSYDANLNLSLVTLPDGTTSSWEYDNRGNCLKTVDPMGAEQSYQFDALNRVTCANLADGNQIRLQYNGYDEVANAKDKHAEVSFTYTSLGSLKSRSRKGRTIEFKYDTEERLVSVKNENGEVYEFERDSRGLISREAGYDGATRTYERDRSGFVTRINRPGGRWTDYSLDKLGNIARADYYDGTWETFGYNKNGALIEAENGDSSVKFTLDSAGQVVKEEQDNNYIDSGYDVLGNRVLINSSLGTKINIERDLMGQISNLAAAQNTLPEWCAQIQRNELGQEIGRLLPGNIISSAQYDAVGRQTSQRVASRGRDTRRRSYNWDVNYRLISISNELNGAQIAYGYDDYGSLGWSKDSKSGYTYRNSDIVGNLYETSNRSDRIFGMGSRLEKSGVNTRELKGMNYGGYGKLATRGTCYEYDLEGNLVKKVDENGDVWQYEYYGNGMLSKAVKPDGAEVTFKYDALGRRVEKATSEKVTRFVWDGNNPLHEWDQALRSADSVMSGLDCVPRSGQDEKLMPNHADIRHETGYMPLALDGIPLTDTGVLPGLYSPEASNLVTWVFEDGFIPAAKITAAGNYSIITDYLGTPVESYDESGERVWAAELDISGRVKEYTGDVGFIPFRYQGQYQDAETGLYYNRFRYYDPVVGQYTQQDPIGLAGNNPTLYGYVHDPNMWIDPWGLATRTNNGLFHVFHDFILDPINQYSSDAVQFNRANQDLLNTMKGNPSLRRDLLKRHPELSNWLKKPNMSASPSGYTWHHQPQTGRLSLVDRLDHSNNHGLYHPEGGGGRDIWGGGQAGREGKLDGATGKPKCP
jgi:RHS repeat-associated protein